MGIKKLQVITNDWHMPRTRLIFSFVFGLNSLSGQPADYGINYLSVEDGISDQDILDLRRQKELSSLQSFEKNIIPTVHSLSELHLFLFNQHSAYASHRLSPQDIHQVDPRNKMISLDPKLLNTY